jgi:hypothetical protein
MKISRKSFGIILAEFRVRDTYLMTAGGRRGRLRTWHDYHYGSEGSIGEMLSRLTTIQGAAGRYGGFDRFGRVTDQKWVKSSEGSVLDRYMKGPCTNTRGFRNQHVRCPK